jgi:hypothetical protein
VVQSGSMALFAVTVKDGVIEGTRRYLFSISQGEALFGTAVNSVNESPPDFGSADWGDRTATGKSGMFSELVANGRC